MEDNIAIKLEIAQRVYTLTVARNEEALFRKAAKTIDNSINAYASKKAYRDKQDLLVMVLLQTVITLIRTEDKFDNLSQGYNSTSSSQIQLAKEIDNLLDSVLNNLTTEDNVI